jgi:hypothetical protein
MAGNAFPVIRTVVERYDDSASSPAQHTLRANFMGYRAKDDITALPPGYLVDPSQNVLHLASGLIYSRPGYSLDGQSASSSIIYDPIQSSYDWITHLGYEQHIRVHNGAMEYRYQSSTGTVSWLPLMTQATMQTWNGTSGLFRFAEYWNATEEIDQLLFVNGDGNVYSWGGAQATLASVSSSALSVTPFLSSTPPGEVITVVGTSQLTSFSGTTTTSGNSILSATVNGQVLGWILLPNQPANGDTITLTINGTTITLTFVVHPYGGLTAAGYGQGSVGLGYNWTNQGSGNYVVYLPNLSSPNVAYTAANVLACLTNFASAPGTGFSNFVAFSPGSVQAAALATLNLNSNPVVSGSTTTSGNTVSSSGQTLVFSMPNQPANGDTAMFVLNGQSVQVQFVSVIGSTPGNVLIGGSASVTMTHLLGLLNAPTTTNTTQVAFSTTNALLVGAFSYVVSTGITLQGQQSWTQLGFMDQTSGRGVIINGQVFTYTGGEGTLTLTGVSPDPTTTPSPALTAGLPIVQAPMVSPITAITSMRTNFNPNLIACVGNQVFYGSTTARDFYVSQPNDAFDCTVSSPARYPTDGGYLVADAALTAFVVQETTMYVSCAPDWWYTVVFGPIQTNPITNNDGSTMTYSFQTLVLSPLKVSPGQGAYSQEGVFKVKNSVFVLTNEPAIDDLGRIQDDLALPEAQTLTDSIKNNFLNYDFTGVYGIYAKYFLYVVLPAEGLMLVYNFFQQWWEAPQIFPFGRLSIINGDLYGHSAQVPETYRVFIDNPLDPNVVYSDNGNPINCIAAFSYDNFGVRDRRKNFGEIFIEGYIQPNTTLTVGEKYDFGGYSGLQTFSLSGANPANLVFTYADNSLGKVPLGKNPIGSITDSISNTPKFRHIFTTIKIDFFEYQQFFQSYDVDQQWQLLAYAVDDIPSDSKNSDVKT